MKSPKFAFEINWPLVGIIKNIFISGRAYCPNIYIVPRQVESFVITWTESLAPNPPITKATSELAKVNKQDATKKRGFKACILYAFSYGFLSELAKNQSYFMTSRFTFWVSSTCFINQTVIKKEITKGQLISKCHHFDQKTNEIFLRISALASKERLNQKLYYTNYVK